MTPETATELLKQLKDMRKRFFNCATISGKSDPEFVDIACEQADAAIAKAEAESNGKAVQS